MPTISDIPAEILSVILELACTDAPDAVASIDSHHSFGLTLSLVCTSFRQIIQSCGLDIQHAYVHGIYRMDLFLTLLQQRIPYAKRVRSLMLADYEQIYYMENYFTKTALQLVIEILATIDSSALHVLSIFLCYPYAAGQAPNDNKVIFPTPLPALTDLFLSGVYVENPELCVSSPLLPNVLRAQITRMAVPSEHIPEDLARLTPNLIRLKLGFKPSTIAGINLAVPLAEYQLAAAESYNSRAVYWDSDEEEAQPQQQQQVLSPTCTHAFPPTLRQVVVSFEPCYLPYYLKEAEDAVKATIVAMDRGAQMFEQLRPWKYDSDEDLDEDYPSDEEEWEPMAFGKMNTHRSMTVCHQDEQERFRSAVQNWKMCTADRKVAWKP
ncbi:hypothetical protein EIP91_004074 [Steccherinum ochraceum]|uniref:F-box domain-containing protein n=1 Tax=Steccherinum ochraceum TaxID=92696 RepID=A0A4R0R9H6_9APHY|nr:hypothetical protein EIP91_004074 [Steccherinum ochraceum]